MSHKLFGYQRHSGVVGFRNIFLLVAATPCVEGLVKQLNVANWPNVKVITYRTGCTLSDDFSTQLRALVRNGNILASHIVTMGCDSLKLPEILDAGRSDGIDIGLTAFQDIGSINNLEKIVARHVASSFEHAPDRIEVAWSSVTLGLKCGGSDYSNGLLTNPFLGRISGKLVELGVKIIVSEPVELVGIEDQLEKICASRHIFSMIENRIGYEKHRLLESGTLHSIMAQGNFDGGISTIEEKSAGSFSKFSGTKIVGVLDVNEECIAKAGNEAGVYFQLGTHQEPQCMTLMAAAGAQGVLFATGRGGVFTHPVSPIYSLCGNQEVINKMQGLFDFELSFERSHEVDVENRFIRKISKWLSGEYSKAEELNLDSFDFYSSKIV